MSKKLLAGPYLLWMIGFTIIPLALIVYYGFTDRSGAFTLENILAIATAEHAKALWLSLALSLTVRQRSSSTIVPSKLLEICCRSISG